MFLLCLELKENLPQQELLNNYLINEGDSEDAEGQVFYLKMKGDYLRYKAEVANKDSGDNKEGEYFHPINTKSILVQMLSISVRSVVHELLELPITIPSVSHRHLNPSCPQSNNYYSGLQIYLFFFYLERTYI